MRPKFIYDNSHIDWEGPRVFRVLRSHPPLLLLPAAAHTEETEVRPPGSQLLPPFLGIIACDGCSRHVHSRRYKRAMKHPAKDSLG